MRKSSSNEVERALGYPYPLFSHSFLLTEAGPRPLAGAAGREGRHAVLGAGSNQSPEQLLRKFRGLLAGGILVERAVLHGFDSVYSGHITSYGSIPATLWPSEGTRLTLFVAWLDDEQLARMHETESLGVNYDAVDLTALRLEADFGEMADQALAYQSRRGAFTPDGEPVALKEIRAEGRRFQALTQREVQMRVRDVLRETSDEETFIRGNVADEQLRRSRTQALPTLTCPIGHP